MRKGLAWFLHSKKSKRDGIRKISLKNNLGVGFITHIKVSQKLPICPCVTLPVKYLHQCQKEIAMTAEHSASKPDANVDQKHTDSPIKINFDNSYFNNLNGFYQLQLAEKAPDPQLIIFNYDLAASLAIELNGADETALAQAFSGSQMIRGAQPLAQVYAGHQFGHYNPQLGDGRAVLIGEVIDANGQRNDIQLKGSGRTPYSRSGDGKAAIGPVLREYLLCEAMHALDIPTTRALAAVSTGEQIWRNAATMGAIVTRTASSHIRIGTFQFFAANDEQHKVKQLADYVIERHYPDVKNAELPYLELLRSVCEQQAKLIAKWQLVGFVHGVMNTDNTSISGETIDYGPCAFMDTYHPNTLFSSIDAEGRYAYRNQPHIAQWNLARFAETLLPLISEDEEHSVNLATNALHAFMKSYDELWLKGMREKLGITNEEQQDIELVDELLAILSEHKVDYTQFFRSLSSSLPGDSDSTHMFFSDAKTWNSWKESWYERLSRNTIAFQDRKAIMNNCNPIYIPRNHKVEEVIKAAEQDQDFIPFKRLLKALENPFTEQSKYTEYSQPAPSNHAPYRTYCGT